MKKKVVLLLFLAIAPTLITLLSSHTPSVVSSSLHPLIPSSLSAQIPADGLVAWYPFNGNANDESGNGNNGTVNGATLTTDRFGNANRAYGFAYSGVSNIQTSAIGPQGSSDRTLSFWFNQAIDNQSSDSFVLAAYGRLFEQGTFFNSGTFFTPIIGLDNELGFDILGNNIFYPNPSPSIGDWHMYTAVYSSTFGNRISSVKVYLDGLLLSGPSQFNESFDINTGSFLPLCINDVDGNQTFPGKMDDVALYSRVLTPSEIQQLYQDQTGQVQQPLTCNITTPVTSICEGETITLSMNTTGGAGSSSQLPANLQQGLVAYYPFNGNANDESGNGNHGVSTNVQYVNDRAGYTNNCALFNGTGYIDINHVLISNVETSYTYSFWIKSSQANSGIVLTDRYGGDCGYKYSFVNASTFTDISNEGLFCTAAIHNTNPWRVNEVYSNFDSTIWNSVIVVYQSYSSKLSLYINGQLASENAEFVWNSASNPTRIGSFLGCGIAPHSFLVGKLDDLLFYNRALSPSEIQQLYNAQSLAWNNGETSPSITVAPSTDTTYSCTVTQGSQTCTASVDITVNPNVTNAISATIIEGETYTLGAQTLTTAGTYTEVFSSATGCDSTVTLTLAVEPLLSCEISASTTTLCAGQNITLSEDGVISTSGLIYIGTWNNHFYYANEGAYSIPQILAMCQLNGWNLAAINSSAENQFICSSNNFNSTIDFLIAGENPSGNGVLLDGQLLQDVPWGNTEPNDLAGNETYIVLNGCLWYDVISDDVLSRGFIIESSFSLDKNTTWSTGATTSSISVTPTTDTTYNCTVTQGSQTCTASVDITVNPNVTNAISATIIEGETYTLGSQTLTTAGTHTEVFTSATGCDSTVTLTLAVEPLLTCNITAPVTSICEGESVTLSVNTTGGTGSSSQLPANLQQGLVAYFSFNTDFQEDTNPNLFFENEFASTPVQVINESLYLDGNSSLVSYSPFIFSDEYSFIFNIRTSQLDNNNWPWGAFIFCRDISGVDSDWSIGIGQGGKIQFNIGSSGDDFTTSFINVNDGVWHTVACIKKANGDYFIVVDGEIQSLVKNTNNVLSNNSVPIKIGNAADSPNFHTKFIGEFDELYLYQRALSILEVSDLVNNQNCIWSTGATTPTITVFPTETTTYTATVSTATQTCTDSITVTVNPLLDWYADADGDGFGDANNVVQNCNQPIGYVADNADCNDDDAQANPSAEEICDNNRDDNCDGQIDENCTVLGCIDPSACNYNELANTDDSSCILPQPEICDGLDNNCNNQIDEGLAPTSVNAVAFTTSIYPVCVGNNIRSANLNNGVNSPTIEGNGNDLWYSFTAQFNTFRAGLSAATGDNDIRLFSVSAGGCLILLETEHEATTGNQTLLTDQLIVGQNYYVAVHNISGPMNASAKMCFSHLTSSTCDHYYSNNTGIYTSVCNSFKAQFRANAMAYAFDVMSATQNNVNLNVVPWTYTTTSSNSVVARLGTILPANQGSAPIVYTLQIPVLCSLPDGAGNLENLTAQATSTCTLTLNAEPTIALRSTDRCPNNKSITGTIAPDRTVCGAMRYDWEFTQVLPTAGTAQVVQGGAYASAFFLSNIPGVATGKTYSVRVRPVHTSGTTGNWGAAHCMRIGAVGMVMQSENQNESDARMESRVSSISIYPNPTTTGSFVLQYNGTRRGEWIFAQEPTTTESTFAQELVMLDITGKVVFKTNVVVNSSPVEIKFGDLASGVYVVVVGDERLRLIVE